MPTEMFDTGLTLTAPEGVSAAQLEDDMFDVITAVEQHAGDAVLGPAAALNLATSTIDVAFTVSAGAISEAQAVVGRVLQVIEEHTSLDFSQADTHTQRPANRDYVLSC